MHALTEDGFLVKLTDFREEEEYTGDGTKVIKATVETVADLGMGRPLGGKFDSDNTLYIADAHLGLTRLKDHKSGHGKVELVASRVFNQGNWTQILYANDVAIGPKTGLVYFTDSTEIAPERVGTHTYDTMYGAKSEALKVSKTGRILRYDPKTDEVQVMARGLHFPNGIAVDKDETHVFFAETFALRMMKYSLKDDTLEVVVDEGLTGYPDGADCAWKGATSTRSSSCYAVMPSAMTPLLKKVMAIGHPWDMVVRTLLMGLPKSLAPPVKTYGGLIEINIEASNEFQLIQDPFGSDIGMLTGVTVYDNRLYLGSLKNEFVGVYQL